MGTQVTSAVPNSPAERGGVRAGDVIVYFDGVRIEDDNHLVNLVSLTPVNKDVPVVVFRAGRSQAMTVRVGDRNAFDAEK
jgi:serine protease Do